MLGEGSSSPNVSRTIESIEKRGTRRERYQIVLSDGSSFFVPAAIWVPNSRNPGDAADSDWVATLQEHIAAREIRERALAALALREHSRAQLERKLSRFQFPEDMLKTVLTRLEEEGLLDDGRFSDAWIRSRMRRHPEGTGALLGGLLRAGVARSEAEAAIARAVSQDETLLDDALRAAVDRLTRSKALDRQTLIRRLTSRGFSYGRISRYLEGRENF